MCRYGDKMAKKYWLHRIGRGKDLSYAFHFDALRDLLFNKNCLTIGWHDLIYNITALSDIETHNDAGIRHVISTNYPGSAPVEAQGLVNFSHFEQGDIVVVLLIPEYETNFLVVEIQTNKAQSILKVPSYMQSSFLTYILYSSGREIYFDHIDGFCSHTGHSPVDAGFFHEVKILHNIPREQMPPQLKTLANPYINEQAQATNFLITKPNIQHEIDIL